MRRGLLSLREVVATGGPFRALRRPRWAMTLLRSAPGLRLRTAEPADIPLLARWRTDPRVLEFYAGRDRPLDEAGVRARYFCPHRDPTTGRFYEYRACVAETGSGPVGFVQYYRLPRADAGLFGCSPEERAYAVDLFLGEPARWGHGLGSRLLALVRDHLVERRDARRIFADPRVENLRSVRALEKAGFRKVQLLAARSVHEGDRADCWLMEYP